MKKIENILLVEKITDFEYHQSKNEPKFKRNHEKRMENILNDHNMHNEFTDSLVDIIEKSGIKYDRCKNNELNEKNYADYEMILSVGGDGTFLASAEKVCNQLMLGANSTYTPDNGGSAGGLTTIDSRDIYQLKRLFTGDYNIEKWRRLSASINDKEIKDLAVNDIYIGHKSGYKASYLEIEAGDEHESFVSSGALFTTGMGSHAWWRAIGGSQFENYLDVFGLIVREPFEKHEKYKFTSKILPEKEKSVIYPERDNYVVVFDSKDKEYPISIEDYVTIGLSDKSINVVKFD